MTSALTLTSSRLPVFRLGATGRFHRLPMEEVPEPEYGVGAEEVLRCLYG